MLPVELKFKLQAGWIWHCFPLQVYGLIEILINMGKGQNHSKPSITICWGINISRLFLSTKGTMVLTHTHIYERSLKRSLTALRLLQSHLDFSAQADFSAQN